MYNPKSSSVFNGIDENTKKISLHVHPNDNYWIAIGDVDVPQTIGTMYKIFAKFQNKHSLKEPLQVALKIFHTDNFTTSLAHTIIDIQPKEELIILSLSYMPKKNDSFFNRVMIQSRLPLNVSTVYILEEKRNATRNVLHHSIHGYSPRRENFRYGYYQKEGIRIEPEKPEEKPEILFEKYKPIFAEHGYDIEKIPDKRERDIVAKHIVTEQYKTWSNAMKPNYKNRLDPFITHSDAVKNMTSLNTDLKYSNGSPSFINQEGVKDLISTMDISLELHQAQLETATIIYVKAPELFRYLTSFLGGRNFVGEVYDYMMGTLTFPSSGGAIDPIIKLTLPKGIRVGAINNSDNIFIQRNQGLEMYSFRSEGMHGISVWIAQAMLIKKSEVQQSLLETKKTFQIAINDQCSAIIRQSAVDHILNLSTKTKFIDISEVNGLYAQLQLDLDMSMGNMGAEIFGTIPYINAVSDTINKLEKTDGLFQLTDQHPKYWGSNSHLLGDFDRDTNTIKVFYSPEIALNQNAHLIRTQLGYAMDALTLRYAAMGPNDKNISSLSQSESFRAIFELDKDNFKPLGGKKPAATPEEYFAAVFASMYSTNQTERQRVQIQAGNAVAFIQIKMEIANKVLDSNSSSQEWDDFAKYLKMEIQLNDKLEYFLQNDLLESELRDINNQLFLFDGDLSKLTLQQQEIVQNLQTRFDNCPTIPHQVVLNSEENPIDYVKQSYTDQEGVTKDDVGIELDGDVIYNIQEQDKYSILTNMGNAANTFLLSASNNAMVKISNLTNAYTTSMGTIFDIEKSLSNNMKSYCMSVDDMEKRVNTKVAKFNANFYVNAENQHPRPRSTLLDVSELTTLIEKGTAVDFMKTIMDRLMTKTLPAPILNLLLNSLSPYCIKVTSQIEDEKKNKIMPSPFKAEYSTEDNKITLQRFPVSRVSIRDFTNDLLYTLGFMLYKSSDFQATTMKLGYDFHLLFLMDGVVFETLQLLSGQKEPINSRFTDQIPEQFAFLLSYIFNTSTFQRQIVQNLFPITCEAIENILRSMSRDLSYFYK